MNAYPARRRTLANFGPPPKLQTSEPSAHPQYRGCCGMTQSSTDYFLSRMISVSHRGGLKGLPAVMLHDYDSNSLPAVVLAASAHRFRATACTQVARPPSRRPCQVVAGCVWAALVSNLLLPSYTSDW